MEPIELRTHTRLWQVEKKLYKLYDYTLPMPISLRMLGIFLLTVIPWAVFCSVVGIPFAPPFGHLIWIAPPAGLTYLGSKPVAEGKKLGELLVSQVSFYVSQHKTYAGMAPHSAPDFVHMRADVWRAKKAPASTADTDPAA
jgi:hypothetical protein